MNRQLYEYSFTLRKQIKSRNIRIFLAFVSAIIFITLVTHLLVYPIRQNSDSMGPDIPEKSLILATPIVSSINRGDVVVLKQDAEISKNFFLRLSNSFVSFFTGKQVSLIKNDNYPGSVEKIRRVIALPGDTIFMKDYKLYVKPAGEKHFLTEFELSKNIYNITFCKSVIDWDDTIGVSGNFDEFQLKDDEYFVLGDNRFSCSDSRIWGPLSSDNIKGKVILCYWPFSKFNSLF